MATYRKKKLRVAPASHKETFTDEEVRKLEFEFIKAYSGTSKSNIKILLSLFGGYIKELLISMFFFILKTSPCLALPVVTANIIDLVTLRPDGFLRSIIINVAVIAFLTVMNIPTHAMYAKYQSVVLRQVEAGLRGALVRKLQQLSISFHKEMQSGRIQSKLMQDVETVQELGSQIFSNIPGIIINMITAIVIVLLNKPKPAILLFFVLCIPLSVGMVYFFRDKFTKYNRHFRKDMEHTSANLMDMVEMTEVTRAHALGHHEVQKMTGILNNLANTGFKVDMINALFGALSWMQFQTFQILCLVFSAYLAVKGEITIGDVAMYQSYFTSLSGQVSALVGLLPIITKGLESVSSIGEILGETDIEDNNGKEELAKLEGEYDFKDIHFSYEDDQPLLRGLDLHVNKGETIAIVGESGSGKSTLMNLVLGFIFPNSGQVLVDGKDITEINLHSYRKHLAVVPQSSVLFMGTIRENITYGLDTVTDEQLKKVMDAALLTDFVSKLPNGIDTDLGEHGANLSGGQRQRLSIARALIRNPDVIIFDEATSALDTISESEIQQAINNLSKDKTTFIVAHRLSTIKNADRIAVIKEGVCQEIGTYDELVAKKGIFYEMQKPQMV